MTITDQGIFVSDEPDIEPVEVHKSLSHYLLSRLENQSKDSLLFIDYESDRKWTGSMLKSRILNVATALIDKYGFEPGTMTCLCYDHSDMSVIMAMGVIFAGGVVACAFPKDPYNELLYLSKKVRPKFLFCHGHNINWGKRLSSDIDCPITTISMDSESGTSSSQKENTVTPDGHFIDLYDYDYSSSPSKSKVPVAFTNLSKQIALITMSSGTTGKPKAVSVSHKNCLSELLALNKKTRPFRPCFGCPASLDYISGRILVVGSMGADYTIVIMNGFDAEKYLDAIDKYKINIVYIGAASFYNLITHPKVDRYDITSLISVFPMGAKIVYQDELKRFFEKHPHIRIIRQGFGASETSGMAMNAMTPSKYLTDCENCGRLLPGAQAKIVHPETGIPLGVNQKGMLYLRGPTRFPGYYDLELYTKSPDADEDCLPLVADDSVFDKDGFYITGDIAYFNSDEELYIVGRQKELMSCRGAKKVLPQELEEVIGEHPAVGKVCVLGIPNKRELTLHCPRAFIKPKFSCYEVNQYYIRTSPKEESSEVLTHTGDHKLSCLPFDKRRLLAEDIMDYVNTRVGWEKQLTGGIVILDDLPTLRATGKLDKSYLRKLSQKEVEIYGDRSE